MSHFQFKFAKHMLNERPVVEVWYDDKFIASIYGDIDRANHPRITVITKHGLDVIERTIEHVSEAVVTIETR